MAETLLEYETIDRDQIDAIMDGKKPRPPEDWDDKGPAPPTSEQPKRRPPGAVGDPAADH